MKYKEIDELNDEQVLQMYDDVISIEYKLTGCDAYNNTTHFYRTACIRQYWNESDNGCRRWCLYITGGEENLRKCVYSDTCFVSEDYPTTCTWSRNQIVPGRRVYMSYNSFIENCY